MIRPKNASGTRRIAFATLDPIGFVALRGSLITEAMRRRHSVACLAPSFEPDTRRTLEQRGIECQSINIVAQGFNPFGAYRLKRDAADVLRRLSIGTLGITDLNMVPLLAAAARRARVPHIVPMLGDFPSVGVGDKSLRRAFDAATGLILATAEAARCADRSGWLNPAIEVGIIAPAGIDLVELPAQPMPATTDGLTFLLVTPASDRRAQEIYVAAAADVRRQHPSARFASGKTITSQTIARAHVVVHAGTVDGLVPGVLDALAIARPLIVTDVAGAREVVDERVNGCCIAPNQVQALADAMLTFIRRPEQLSAMARASRSKAELRYDARAIDAATLKSLGLGESFAAAA